MPFGVRLVCHHLDSGRLIGKRDVTNAFRREACLSLLLPVNIHTLMYKVTNAFRREAGLSPGIVRITS